MDPHRPTRTSSIARDASGVRRERAWVLAVAGPAVTAAALASQGPGAPSWAAWLPLLGGALVAAAGPLLDRHPRLARVALGAAIAIVAASLYARLMDSPATLVLFAVAAVGVYGFATARPPAARVELDRAVDRAFDRATARSTSAQRGLGLAAAIGLVIAVLGAAPVAVYAVGVAALASGALVVRWARASSAPRAIRWLTLGLVDLAALALALTPIAPSAALGLTVTALVLAALVLRRAEQSGEASFFDLVLEHPARALVATFLGLAVLATLLLVLPMSAADGQSVGLLDAAFTGVSAVCVTGLIVLDTPHAFSGFGLAALLLLIQVGGLGIMSFYTVTLAALGRRVSLRHERAVAGALSVGDRHHLATSVGRVMIFTGVTEALGALALMACFLRHGDSVGQALWRGVFTSISAFCNAGFALETDSLISYQNDPFVLHVVGLLIIAGGLSPVAVVAIPRWARGRRVPLQPALILWTSAGLIVFGAVLYGLMEWSVSLAPLSWDARLHNAWFQSITLRTAGFNSVDLAVARPSTQALMVLLMFVGGSPGGTAGGVKTTTAAVLLLTVASTLAGRSGPVAFGRRIASANVYKAAAVVTVGLLTAIVALMAVELTQALDPEVALFEVVSALATVGLSIGATAQLDSVGKVIVMVCMFAGRVGPLTLFLFLAERRPAGGHIVYPEAEVEVG